VNGARPAFGRVLGFVSIVSLILTACGGSDNPVCNNAPLLTYNNFGEGFLASNCQSCHASTSPNRKGAPESVTFDTPDQIQIHRERMLVRATGDDPTMPPGGGLTPSERTSLEIWLDCFEGR